MNLAVVVKAPAIFVFENNHYSEHTGVDYAVGTNKDIASRAEAFGMKAWRANGCDYFDTYDAMRELLDHVRAGNRSEEHTSELQSLMRISYAVFCLKKKKNKVMNE